MVVKDKGVFGGWGKGGRGVGFCGGGDGMEGSRKRGLG